MLGYADRIYNYEAILGFGIWRDTAKLVSGQDAYRHGFICSK